MQVLEKELAFGLEPDAGWIFSLWKAIHGGDPAPETMAAGVIASMTPFLNRVGVGCEAAHVPLTHGQVEALDLTQPILRRQYCFKSQGRNICITLPDVQAPPYF